MRLCVDVGDEDSRGAGERVSKFCRSCCSVAARLKKKNKTRTTVLLRVGAPSFESEPPLLGMQTVATFGSSIRSLQVVYRRVGLGRIPGYTLRSPGRRPVKGAYFVSCGFSLFQASTWVRGILTAGRVTDLKEGGGTGCDAVRGDDVFAPTPSRTFNRVALTRSVQTVHSVGHPLLVFGPDVPMSCMRASVFCFCKVSPCVEASNLGGAFPH